MKNVLILLISLGIYAGAVHAADDPMQSLFTFQQKMAANGSSSAMMKLGEMYEQGQGTKQDFDKALEMYKKAKINGHTGADAAIKRLQNRKNGIASAAEKKRKAQEQARKRKEAQERERARKQAEQKRLAAEKAAKEKAAKAKAQREAQAKKQAQEAARKRAAAEQARKAELERRRLAAEKRRQEAERARLAKAKAEAQAANKQTAEKKDDKGFKSDPCRGAAARVMSICKGK